MRWPISSPVARNGSGVPVIAITALVGTSFFASLSTAAVSLVARIAVGMVSILATVLASLQTFFKYSENAEKHKIAAARFGMVRRKLEILSAGPDDGLRTDAIREVREQLDHLAEDSPHIPVRVFEKIERNPQYARGSNPASGAEPPQRLAR